MTPSLKHSAQKGFKNQQRDRTPPREQQLEIFSSAPSPQKRSKPAIKCPLVIKPERTAYVWGRKRYRVYCAYSGEQFGFPLYEHEVEYLLARIGRKRSAITHDDFWSALESLSKAKRCAALSAGRAA